MIMLWFFENRRWVSAVLFEGVVQLRLVARKAVGDVDPWCSARLRRGNQGRSRGPGGRSGCQRSEGRWTEHRQQRQQSRFRSARSPARLLRLSGTVTAYTLIRKTWYWYDRDQLCMAEKMFSSLTSIWLDGVVIEALGSPPPSSSSSAFVVYLLRAEHKCIPRVTY